MTAKQWLPRVIANMGEPRTIESSAVEVPKSIEREPDLEDLAIDVERAKAAWEHGMSRAESLEAEYLEALAIFKAKLVARGLE